MYATGSVTASPGTRTVPPSTSTGTPFRRAAAAICPGDVARAQDRPAAQHGQAEPVQHRTAQLGGAENQRRLELPRRGIEAGVQDARVRAARGQRQVVLGLEQRRLDTPAGERERDGGADDAPSDHRNLGVRLRLQRLALRTLRETPMTLDELKKAVHEGTVDTVLLTIADMEGRLQGKRLTAAHFLDEVVEHDAEGCNYLLAVDVDMDTVDRLRHVVMGARLRRLRVQAGSRHPAPDPVARGDGAPHGRPRVGGRERGGGFAAPDPAPPARSARGARLARHGRDRARVHGVQRHLRGGVAEGLPRPRAGQPLQRRLLDGRHRADRAADPAHPQLDDGRRDARRELEGRVQLRPARDQLPLLGRALDCR